MPRKYSSQGKRGQWSEEQLKLAVTDVVMQNIQLSQEDTAGDI